MLRLTTALLLCYGIVGEAFTNNVFPSAPVQHLSQLRHIQGGAIDLGGEVKAVSSPAGEVKAPPALFQNAVTLGQGKATSSVSKIFILGILSGVQIGFGMLLAAMVGGDCGGLAAANNAGLKRIITGAFGLPFGLYMVIVGGGELYTGNTALVTAALLEGKATPRQLAKNWITSYFGNFVGSLLMVFAVTSAGIISNTSAVVGLAAAKTAVSFSTAFWRGVLCNYLVSMAVWMATGCSSAVGKICSIFLPISAFVALGTDHSVANMFLLPLGIFYGNGAVTVKEFFFKNLIPVTLGNTFAGAICVATMFHLAYGNPKFQK